MSRTHDYIIDVQAVSTGYGRHVIHAGLTFHVKRGEIFVIAGGSGCGKSTLLRHLCGLQPVLAGRIEIDGVPLDAEDDAARAGMARRVGVLFQSGALFGALTLAENIELVLEEYTDLPPAARDAVARTKLAMVGLGGYENYLPSQISGGMKKRAGLARAMALDPPLLFFDEPSAGLDPVTSAELDHLIVELNASLGTTMVVVTHELASIFAIAQRVIMLEKGVRGIVAEGTPRELQADASRPNVYAFFNRARRGLRGAASSA